MSRPLVIVAPDLNLALTLGRDFRWPVLDDPGPASDLLVQGFSLVATCHPGNGVDCEVVEVDAAWDPGRAHQHIAAAGLDPLKLNVDLGVFAWVGDDRGRVLLVRQAYGRSLWALPGGEVHLREAPDAAVVREVREETGYDVTVERLVAVYGRHQHIGMYFGCVTTGGQPRTHFDTEVADVGWFDPGDPPDPLSPVIGLLGADLAGGQVASRFFA